MRARRCSPGASTSRATSTSPAAWGTCSAARRPSDVLDAASVRAVDAARLAPGVVRPLHDGYTFAALPGTVERLLVGETDRAALPAAALAGLPARPERVVLVLLDAFGWRFMQRHADHHPLLRRLLAEGTVAKLTTQFPSTTTAHVTTLHSGRPVGAHGLYEWNLYEPALDVLITPMLFAYAGDNRRDTLWTADLRPRDLYPVSTLYRALADRGVAPHALQPAAFTPSTYDGVVLDGARIHAYERLDEGLAGLAATLRGEPGPAYAYVYIDAVDPAGPQCGPSSAEFDRAVREALDAIEAALPGFPPGTLLLLCADHGQVDVDPERTIFVNQSWPQIAGLLRRGRDGRPLVPAGSARDLFLHVAPGALQPVVEGLRALLGERAEAFGIHPGMRMGEALARCPRLALVPPDPVGVADAWERIVGRLEAVGAAVQAGPPGRGGLQPRGPRPL